jgi:hypothetical protein
MLAIPRFFQQAGIFWNRQYRNTAKLQPWNFLAFPAISKILEGKIWVEKGGFS